MKFLRETTPFTQVIYTLIIILMGGVIFSLFGFLICRIFLGLGFEQLSELLTKFNDPTYVGYLKFFQILQSLGMFILPPLVIAYYLDDHPFQFLKLTVKPTWVMLGLVSVVILVCGPLIEWVSLLNQHLVLPSWMSSLEKWMHNSEEQANDITRAFLSTNSIGGLLGNLFIVAVMPAIGEELLFRGVIQKLLKKMTGSSHWAIWITAILFSALHLQFFGFLPRLLLGALFGYLLEWTDTLWLPIVAHFINNAAGVITFFITSEGLEPVQPDTPLFKNPLFFYAVGSAVIVWFLLKYIYLKREETQMAEIQQVNGGVTVEELGS